ncbi:MAG: hypothetical protein ACR2KV_08540, partial [Solirubrobacteraceae bacterium]
MAVPRDFDLSAASLRADGAELGNVVEVLAAKLEEALPDRTEVRRRGRRPLSRDRRVDAVEVNLASRFLLEAAAGRFTCSRQKIVGGISIKRDVLELGDWLRALTEELDASSGESARARAGVKSTPPLNNKRKSREDCSTAGM